MINTYVYLTKTKHNKHNQILLDLLHETVKLPHFSCFFFRADLIDPAADRRYKTKLTEGTAESFLRKHRQTEEVSREDHGEEDAKEEDEWHLGMSEWVALVVVSGYLRARAPHSNNKLLLCNMEDQSESHL